MSLGDDEYVQIQREFNGLFLMTHGCDEIAAMLEQHPWLIERSFLGNRPLWLCAAAKRHGVDVLKLLLDAGCDVNEADSSRTEWPLSQALTFENVDVVPLLLQHGADPNLGRNLIGVLNIENDEDRYRLLRLFLDHGVDVNQVFSLYGGYDQAFTAIEHAANDAEAQALLRARGAKTAAEITGQADTGRDPLMNYVSDRFGAVAARYWSDRVPHGIPCRVHFCEPKRSMFRRQPRGPMTLFTYGLSWKPLETSSGSDAKERSELFLQIPADFPIGNEQQEYIWPIDWLYQAVNQPQQLGSQRPVSADDSAKGVIPGRPFSCLITVADGSFVRPDGQTVQLYRMLPVYADEYELVCHAGAPALLQRFQQLGVRFEDLDRQSVAMGAG